MRLIVGLGNPGEKYKNTRHNIGFMALDAILSKFEPAEKTYWEEKKDLKSNIKFLSTNTKSQPPTANRQILLAKPTTFMNNSGFSVAKVLNYYKTPTEDLIVIHDDLDLPFGKIRVRFGGSAGGHHGVESIIEQIKTDKFLRIRLGIGSDARQARLDKRNTEEYVLSNISSNERGKVKSMIREATRAIELILKRGIEVYMSRYNKS